MKKINLIAPILFITITFIAGGSASYADDTGNPNLLKNGGFELGMDQWRDFGSGAMLETTTVAEGKEAVYLKKGSGINYLVDGLKPLTKYRLTAKIKVEKTGDSGRLFAQAYNSADKTGRSAMATAVEWTEVALEFQTGPASSTCEVGVWKDAGLGDGGVFVDDLKLVEE